MARVRLPLQVGRAAVDQGMRFAATVWWLPFGLLLAAMLVQASAAMVPLAMVIGVSAIVALGVAIDAADHAKRDAPCDIVLDDAGFAIEGGPLDRTQLAWAKVHADGCTIEHGTPRTAVRWRIIGVLTGGKIAAVERWAKVPVHLLKLPRHGDEPLVLAEVEGDDLESLEQLRDSIRATAAPASRDAPLPQEILRCPHCNAPQVPAATAKMACAACARELDVPPELQQRMRASAELDRKSVPRAAAVRKLVDQPSARRAVAIVRWCRRIMVWVQPVGLVFAIVMIYHQTTAIAGGDQMSMVRAGSSDDAVALYDLCLLALVIAAGFAIAWSIARAYIANRRALRVLADQFGAVPPVTAGAPSSCRQCGAPLPATTALLVHCAYCATENVLGVDPRPAAMRHQRERIDLARGLRDRRRARLRLAITVPVSAVIAFALGREVRIAWHIPVHATAGFGDQPSAQCGIGRCGMVVNGDRVRRVVTLVDPKDHTTVTATALPHGALAYECGVCDVEIDGTKITPAETGATDLRIEHGVPRAAKLEEFR